MNQDNIKQNSFKKTSTPRVRMYSQSAFTTSLRDRPLVHNTQHIDDHGRKNSININERKNFNLDECSLQMTNDPNSVFYRRLSVTLGKQDPIETPPPNEEEEKFKLFEQYGPKLVEFLKDKDGHLKSKFDKVFIT